MVKGQIFAPKVNTCNESIYDYFVVCDELAPAVYDTVAVNDALCSPHKPARLYLRAGPRQMMVRQLKAIGKFEAKMPYGPEPCRCYPEIEMLLQDPGTTNNDLSRVFIDRMEQELIDIYGLDPSKASKFSGRSSGPVFVWRSALNDEIGSRRTTAVSRAWRRTSNWLGEILRTSNLISSKLSVSKVLNYVHPLPNKEKATPPPATDRHPGVP